MDRRKARPWLSLAAVLAVTLALYSCSSANRSAIDAWGKEALVLKYSGGVLVHAGISVGKVESEDHSDGWYYQDKCSGHLVEVAGDVTIERTDKHFSCSQLPQTNAATVARSASTE